MRDESTSLSLLMRVGQHDQNAWTRLVYVYSPLVDHWCRRWGVAATDIEDIRQEVFKSVATGIGAFRLDRPGDTFRGWLRVITHRKFIDYHRRSEHQPKAVGGESGQTKMLNIPESPDLEEDDPSDEVKRLHHRALEMVRSEFEDRSWQAFWRCAVQGQTPADIARDMGITPAAVRKAKSRVLRRLKEEFGPLLG